MKTLKPVAAFHHLWQEMTPELRRRFVKVLGTTPGTARQYAEGRRGISSAVAIRIEKATMLMGTKFPRLNRMQLNETCGSCEFAIRCTKRGMPEQVVVKRQTKNLLPRVRKK